MKRRALINGSLVLTLCCAALWRCGQSESDRIEQIRNTPGVVNYMESIDKAEFQPCKGEQAIVTIHRHNPDHLTVHCKGETIEVYIPATQIDLIIK